MPLNLKASTAEQLVFPLFPNHILALCLLIDQAIPVHHDEFLN